jgi:hypothetical protein
VVGPTLLEIPLGLGVKFSPCEAEWRGRKQRQSDSKCAVCTSVLYIPKTRTWGLQTANLIGSAIMYKECVREIVAERGVGRGGGGWPRRRNLGRKSGQVYIYTVYMNYIPPLNIATIQVWPTLLSNGKGSLSTLPLPSSECLTAGRHFTMLPAILARPH